MAKFVRVGSIQFDAFADLKRGEPESMEKVLRMTRSDLDSLKGYNLDLVLTCELVEAFGLTLETAETVDQPGPFLSAYQDFARTESCHVAGSIKVREGDDVFNSLAFVGPDGTVIGVYHKTFLTENERNQGLRSGDGPRVFDTTIGRLGGVICFDQKFERLRFGYRDLNPDILTFASAYHGGFLQQQWAYECKCYYLTALRFYGGGVIDPLGQPVKLNTNYTRTMHATINLDRVLLKRGGNSHKFPLIEKKYQDEVTVDVPSYLGAALIHSNTDARSAMDIVEEF
ncbi:MAG: carbon-nitrogen hydrolase family protein, partial [Candidatus Latescibacteria bacterium]|nr:carbon-nitrogen hydrolase family protein [Candidatus Latescibacterota bacterium]